MPGYCSPDETPVPKHHYFAWREETLRIYPHVIYLPGSSSISEICSWSREVGVDYLWHLSRFNAFDFQLGYDFFFKQMRDAAFFKLVWGGIVEDLKPLQLHLFYI